MNQEKTLPSTAARELFRSDTEDEDLNGFSDVAWDRELGELAHR